MKEMDEFLEKCKNGKDDVFIVTSGGSFSGNVSSQNNDSFILEPAFNENIQSRTRISNLLIEKEYVIGFGKIPPR